MLDSFGVGALPDSADFGDAGCNTLKSCFGTGRLNVPNMRRLGLFNIDGVDLAEKCPENELCGSFMRIAERSRGKDTTTGHWEIAGVVSEKPFPTFPNGFPQELIERFEQAVGRKVICNKPYSGTKVIADYGREHIETGALIVYTSADSVFQIAAHEDVVPVETLYSYCETARRLLTGDYAVGRVIARPFCGEYPFERTPRRHDYSLVPPKKTMLDFISESGKDVIGVGKISDIFAGQGITRADRAIGNRHDMDATMQFAEEDFSGLCFTNLVDFDMSFGHRRDAAGYAEALNEFDRWLGGFMRTLTADDILFITADHGCDPMFGGTDHTREYIPLMIYSGGIAPRNLGTRHCFGDIAATIMELLGVSGRVDGESFCAQLL